MGPGDVWEEGRVTKSVVEGRQGPTYTLSKNQCAQGAENDVEFITEYVKMINYQLHIMKHRWNRH